MGVAVGRSVSTDGLIIVNYNSTAANLCHPDHVYDFYFQESIEPKADLTCCKIRYESDQEEKENFERIDVVCVNNRNMPSSCPKSSETPILLDVSMDNFPWSLQEFNNKYKDCSFMEGVNNVEILKTICNLHYAIVKDLLKKNPKRNDDFVQLYSNVNSFLIGQIHEEPWRRIEAPKRQKLSTKLFFFILDKEIQKLADTVTERQSNSFENATVSQSSAATDSKIRYIAGASVHQISMRLKGTVMRRLGKTNKEGKFERKWSYQKAKLLKTLTLTEEEIMRTCDRDSLHEIESKQNPGATRGLLHVKEYVDQCFTVLSNQVQSQLTERNLHLDNIHLECRHFILENSLLLQ